MVDASITMLLRTCLAKTTKEQSGKFPKFPKFPFSSYNIVTGFTSTSSVKNHTTQCDVIITSARLSSYQGVKL